MVRKISNDKEQSVVALAQQGYSQREIAKELSNIGITKSTVQRVLQRKGIQSQGGQGGRSKLLDSPEKRLIVRQVTSGKVDKATQVSKDLFNVKGLKVSPQTVRRALNQKGLIASKKQKKPALSQKHKQARLQFAKAHESWTIHDWQKVIWTDETKVNRFGCDGRQWVWKRKEEGLSDRTVQPTIKQGGGNIKVWGCITSKGVGYTCKIDEGLDAKLMVEILQGEFMDTLSYYEYDIKDIIFQQDNDPKHTSKLVQNWLQDKGLNVMKWPAQSPDLNPIENIWDNCKRKLNEYQDQAKGIHELWERFQVKWDEISQDECLKVINSMPNRIQQVLKAKGGYTKY